MTAGRDVNLTSAEQIVSGERGRHRDQTITQYGSDIDVGQDLKVNAGRDITAIASQIDAKRDVNMSAVGDLTLASAADEQHSYSKSKKVTSQEDHVSQVSSTVNAGGQYYPQRWQGSGSDCQPGECGGMRPICLLAMM
ncbi:hemagglutinin repeat-containing protein [Pseudomonas lini]